ncbi:MAG: hypothetical protein V1792_20000 [Pseudomonadota bacterium]
MKYLLVFVIIISLWSLADQFFRKSGTSEGPGSFLDNLKEMGRNLHVMMGILAVIIIVLFAARLLFKGLESP